MTIKSIFTKTAVPLLLCVLMASCASYEDIAYFKNIPSEDSTEVYEDGVLRDKREFTDLKIHPGDILQISVQTKTPNTNNTRIGGLINNQGFTASDWRGAGRVGETRTSRSTVQGFMVDNNGDIELPLVGKLQVDNLTIPQIKEEVRKHVSNYYKDPVINIRLANFKVTVLGEVVRPGTYILEDQRSTLLDALAMAGDMTIYGKRKNVLLARDVSGEERIVRFNMNSTELFNSPYFYLRPGDVVYVQPTKGRAAANDATKIRYYSLAASAVSILVSVLTRIL